MSPQAALAGGALHIDVLVHALDVVDRGVDAGGDGVDLHLDGVQTAIRGGEAFACTILIVPKRDHWRFVCGRTLARLLQKGSALIPHLEWY